MKAVQLSHDRQKLRTLVQDFARDHGLQLPKGLQKDRGKDRFDDRARDSNLAEKQQKERSGITKDERRRDIAGAWKNSRTGQELVQALEGMGYYLAQGDRRDYAIVDQFGEVHSLSRQLRPDVKAKEMKERLADFPPGRLLGVAAAKERAAQWRADRLRALQKEPDIEPEKMRDALRQRHAIRRSALDQKRDELKTARSPNARPSPMRTAMRSAASLTGGGPRNRGACCTSSGRSPALMP